MRLSRMRRIMQIEEGVILRGWRPHLLVDFQTFSLFIGTVSGCNQMFYLAGTPQKVWYNLLTSIEQHVFTIRVFFPHNLSQKNNWAISSTDSRKFSSLLLKKPRFQSNVPSINLVSNQIYHRIDGILLAQSCKYGERQLVIKNYPGDWSQSETSYFGNAPLALPRVV